MSATISDRQADKLNSLRQELASRAMAVGIMHAAWDYIFDIDAMLEGSRGYISDPNGLIEACEKHIREWTE